MKPAPLIIMGGLALIPFAAAPAHAIQFITGHVTLLEPTYMPGKFVLQMDVGNTACPAGTWLSWEKPAVENVQAAYATALAALMGGKVINFVINDNDTTCKGQFLHISPRQ
jgi:hypothetical protein